MFNQFLTALLQKILHFLVAHKDFFEGDSEKRKSSTDHVSIPSAFKEYLIEVSEKQFMHDIKLIILYMEDPKNTNIRNNDFFKSFMAFLTGDLARKVDHLDSKFYLLRTAEKTEVVEKLINADSLLAQTLKTILIQNNYQQLASAINTLGSKSMSTPHITVQSPREIDAELKKEIRTHLASGHPLTLPIFQTNKRLIGGLRVFVDGIVTDNSWLTRVLRFTSLTA